MRGHIAFDTLDTPRASLVRTNKAGDERGGLSNVKLGSPPHGGFPPYYMYTVQYRDAHHKHGRECR